jgi:hypothetical protein
VIGAAERDVRVVASKKRLVVVGYRSCDGGDGDESISGSHGSDLTRPKLCSARQQLCKQMPEIEKRLWEIFACDSADIL